MKTLYSILGIAHDASAAQIETAYAGLLAEISQSQGENERVRLIAIKEAYGVLSDPIKRQLYNQKLFAPEPSVVYSAAPSHVAESFGLKKILVIGALAIGGLVLYSNNARERERLRIEHEHEVQMRAVQVLENAQQQVATEQEARLARQQQIDAQNRERQEKAEFDRFNREAENRRIQNERLQQQQAQREQYEQDARKRQEANDARQRAYQQEAELRRLQREQYSPNRGRVVSLDPH